VPEHCKRISTVTSNSNTAPLQYQHHREQPQDHRRREQHHNIESNITATPNNHVTSRATSQQQDHGEHITESKTESTENNLINTTKTS